MIQYILEPHLAPIWMNSFLSLFSLSPLTLSFLHQWILTCSVMALCPSGTRLPLVFLFLPYLLCMHVFMYVCVEKNNPTQSCLVFILKVNTFCTKYQYWISNSLNFTWYHIGKKISAISLITITWLHPPGPNQIIRSGEAGSEANLDFIRHCPPKN